MMHLFKSLVLLVSFGCFATGTLQGQDNDRLRILQERLEALERRVQTSPPKNLPAATSKEDAINRLEARLEALERQLNAAPPRANSQSPLLTARTADSSQDQAVHPEPMKSSSSTRPTQGDWLEVGKNLKLSTQWSNGLHAETADQAFKTHIGGRFEWDNSWFTQDNNLLIGTSPAQKMQDGTLFRRVRLRADGSLWEFIDYAVEVNFANIQDVGNVQNETVPVGSVGLTDCFLSFRDVPLVGNVRVGHLQAPVGLERMTSANALYYMERSSLFDAFLSVNNFQNGILVFDSFFDDRVTVAGCLSWIGKATVNSFGFAADEGNYGASARVSVLPVYAHDGRCLVHLGLSFQNQALVDNSLVVANRPLLRAGAGGSQTPNLLNTGTFFTPQGANVLDFEFAWVAGPFALSGEFAVARIDDLYDKLEGGIFSGPRGDVTYQAAYLEGGCFLTPGDYRRFDKKQGTWDRTVPVENAFFTRGPEGRCLKGQGAVQVLARYTYLDLVSGAPVLTPTSGGARAGRQQDITLGLNWYLNSQTRIMANYVWTHLDSVVPGASGNLQGVGFRFHIDF